LDSTDNSRLLRVALDVTRADMIEAAVNATVDQFGAVDVLVNNAGTIYLSTQEEADLDQVRDVFETNVFGTIALTKRILPLMRVRQQGTIVNVSSISGRITTPGGGFYQASKWALEAVSEALYLEVCSFGVRVVVVEPGSFDTGFGRSATPTSSVADGSGSPYAALRERWATNTFGEIVTPGQHPNEVIEAIVAAASGSTQFERVPVGKDATAMITRREEMGADFVEWIRQALYR
jgi:NAD(P)-dependent dehydrogenase (short-subunit alcohol dehydrogenase family)